MFMKFADWFSDLIELLDTALFYCLGWIAPINR